MQWNEWTGDSVFVKYTWHVHGLLDVVYLTRVCHSQENFRRIFAPIRRKSLKKLPLGRRRRIFSGFCQTANGPDGEQAVIHPLHMLCEGNVSLASWESEHQEILLARTGERHDMDAVAQYMQQAGNTVVCVILVTVLIFTIWQVYIAFRR